MIESTLILALAEGLVRGGPVAILAYIIFHMYRKDRKSSEETQRQDRVFMEDRLNKIIERDQDTREKNTQAITELTSYLKSSNGKDWSGD